MGTEGGAQYLVVKASPAGLVFGNKLRLKAGEPVATNLNWQFTELAFEGFLAATVAGVARWIGDGFVLAVSKVFGHLGFERTLDQTLGELTAVSCQMTVYTKILTPSARERRGYRNNRKRCAASPRPPPRAC